jgi:hypothetical protein
MIMENAVATDPHPSDTSDQDSDRAERDRRDKCDDGTVTFMVDHVAVGRVTATKIDIVSPGYAEYVYRNGALELQSDNCRRVLRR